MVRTWTFTAAPAQDPRIAVAVERASVSQSSASVELRITNRSDAPMQVAVETLILHLEDGTTCEGKTSFARRALAAVQGGLAAIGIGKGAAPTPPLQPGAQVDLQVDFRLVHRDLRRHPLLRIDLSGLLVDGAPSGLAPLQLVAPPRAPIGEDI